MDFFLATMLTCADGRWILSGIVNVELTSQERSELVAEVTRHMPDNCTDKDYNPAGRKRP